MDFERLVSSLDNFGSVLPALVQNMSPQDAKWKPESGNWSVLEIVCHLVDEETHDFRRRIQSTLEDPSRGWPAIDPEAWAIERNYNSEDLAAKVGEFEIQRRKSIEYLKSVKNSNWDNTYQHPSIGPIKAADLLAAWAAHDHLHARQLAKRRYEIVLRDAKPHSTLYAGDWTA